MKKRLSITEYLEGIISGNRMVLSKAFTLIESKLPGDIKIANELMTNLKSHGKDALRIGISGIPGAGKSTFIEGMGECIIRHHKKVAVLTIDPSSVISKGSILADKTRMVNLSKNEHAFIRTSPSHQHLGGATPHTRKLILLCEAAGFDVIIIESVGTGQSEIDVQTMTDFFLLLLISGAGDEFQIMKKGILELADYILINKADGNNLKSCTYLLSQISTTMHLINSGNSQEPAVRLFSSFDKKNFEDLWDEIYKRYVENRLNGNLVEKRKLQLLTSFQQLIEQNLKSMFFNNPLVANKLKEKVNQVVDGTQTEEIATYELFEIFKRSL